MTSFERAPWPYPAIFAHRCGGLLAPENTLAGLDVANRMGCGAEFDVMLSGSASPVLMHDETLDRTTDGTGRVADTPDERLRELDAGCRFEARFAGERVPTFEEAAGRCLARGIDANIEIKPSAGHDELTARIVASRARALWERAQRPPLLSSFSQSALAVASAVAPDLPRGWLVGRIPDDWSARARALGVVALHADARTLDRAQVHRVRDAGLWLVAYTENDPDRAVELFEWGVDCIITDFPGVVHPPATRGA